MTHGNHVFDRLVFDPAPVFDTGTSGIWNATTIQSETWVASGAAHTFDRLVFDPAPVFDTGTSGIWNATTIQSNVWTVQ